MRADPETNSVHMLGARYCADCGFRKTANAHPCKPAAFDVVLRRLRSEVEDARRYHSKVMS